MRKLELHERLLFCVELGLTRKAIDDLAAVAAVHGFYKFDRLASEKVRGPGKAKYGSLFADAEKASFFRGSNGGFGDFIGEFNLDAVVLGESPVERLARIEFLLQVRTEARGDVGALDTERHGIGKADAAEEEDFILRGEMQGFGDVGSGMNALEGKNAGTGARAAGADLLAEGEDLAKILFELDAGNEGAFAALAVSDTETAKGFEGLAGGHAADAHALGDFLFGRDGLTCLESAGANLIEQAPLDLVVERDDALAIEGSGTHEALQPGG
jgi:hypothetical protein